MITSKLIIKRQEYGTRWLLLVFLFVVLCDPGFSIMGEVINLCDFFIPTYFIALIWIQRPKVKKKDLFKTALLLFVFVAVISIFIASIKNGKILFVPFLKWFRLLEEYMALIIGGIIAKNIEFSFFSKWVMRMGCISAFVGIILFVTQNEQYAPNQMYMFGGRYLYRAGGPFRETASFGMCMALIILFTIFNSGKRKKLAILTVIVSCIGIALSLSRLTILALCIVLIYNYFSSRIMEQLKAIAKWVWVAIPTAIIVARTSLGQEVLNRMLTLLNDDASANDISSGRLGLWSRLLQEFSTRGVIETFFGTGYKVDIDGELTALGDNGYLSALTTMGIFGAIALLILIAVMFKVSFKSKQNNAIFKKTLKSFCLFFIITMLFGDMMTCYRIMIFIFFIFGIMQNKSEDMRKTLEGVNNYANNLC